ncbi:hypothetical protein C8J57DRAFT_1218351 [Mycena rebaudengoi]|nr:hypothetical protein C8J57DRAFT_1218351 [Mycena rebaudengoi]
MTKMGTKTRRRERTNGSRRTATSRRRKTRSRARISEANSPVSRKYTSPRDGKSQSTPRIQNCARMRRAEDPEDGEGGAPRKKMRMTTQRGRAVWLRAQGQVVLMTRTWGERASDNANKIDKKNAQNKIKYMQKWKGREEKPRATKDEDGNKGRQRRANERMGNKNEDKRRKTRARTSDANSGDNGKKERRRKKK